MNLVNMYSGGGGNVAAAALLSPLGQAIGRTTRSLFGLPAELTEEGIRQQEVVGTPTTSYKKVLRKWYERGRESGSWENPGTSMGIASALALQGMEKPITSMAEFLKKQTEGRPYLSPLGSNIGPEGRQKFATPEARTVAEAEYYDLASQVFEGSPGSVTDAINEQTKAIRNRQAASGLYFSQAAASAEAAAKQGTIAQLEANIGSSYWDLMSSTGSVLQDPRGGFLASRELYNIGREYQGQMAQRQFSSNRRPLGT